MSYYRSEDNIYCDSIKKSVEAGQTVNDISIHSHGPCKISSILAKFSTPARGDFNVKLIRDGLELDIISTDLDDNESVVATDINVWLPHAGHSNYSDTKIVIDNQTLSDADVIIDYTY